MVKLLLSQDVAANSGDNGGRTPLWYAARRGHEAIVRLLLCREDVVADSQDEQGETPMSKAAKYGHEAVVKLLEQNIEEVSLTRRKRRIGEISED